MSDRILDRAGGCHAAEMDEELRTRVEDWIRADPDADDRAELSALLAAGDEAALTARFGAPLRFGTAGLRGPLQAGPSGMNRAVVRRAAAGLAAFLHEQGDNLSVAVGHDARHGSASFAADCAAVLAGAGIRPLLLDAALPTPVLAFAVRELGAAAGMMITASHNPPQDNGCKVYLADGAQIVPPADEKIEAAIDAVGPAGEIPLGEPGAPVGPELVEAYVTAVAALSLVDARDVSVVATALHGVGRTTLDAVFARAGLPPVAWVPEQADGDPDFPTVDFPNPEEPGAMDLVLALGERTGADLVIALDPDADRCGAAIGGRVLRGDEIGALLADHVLRHRPGPVACSLVSSELLGVMAAAHGVAHTETLTGFKWIVRASDELAFGYEEALGYSVAPWVVRDKDGISAALFLAERAAELKAEGRTLLDRLDELACEHGLYRTDQLAIRVEDTREIEAATERLRSAPPEELGGLRVEEIHDLLNDPGDRPPSDILVLRLEGHVRVVVRPSGTEPKLKAYLQAIETVGDGDVAGARARAGATLAAVRDALPDVLGLAP